MIVGGIYSVYMSLGSSCVHWVLCGVWEEGCALGGHRVRVASRLWTVA